MTWIMPASFICGALALVNSLYVSGLQFNRVRNARKALDHFSREFKDSLRCIARRNKVWLAVIGAVSLLFLYTRDYGASFALWAGVVAPIYVGSLSAAIRTALSERSSDVDCQVIQYKSKFLSGQMVMACGLLGSAAILCLASLEDLRRLGMGGFVLVSFAFGVCGGAYCCFRGLARRRQCLQLTGRLQRSKLHSVPRRRRLHPRQQTAGEPHRGTYSFTGITPRRLLSLQSLPGRFAVLRRMPFRCRC